MERDTFYGFRQRGVHMPGRDIVASATQPACSQEGARKIAKEAAYRAPRNLFRHLSNSQHRGTGRLLTGLLVNVGLNGVRGEFSPRISSAWLGSLLPKKNKVGRCHWRRMSHSEIG